jgi:hypothetical protein
MKTICYSTVLCFLEKSISFLTGPISLVYTKTARFSNPWIQVTNITIKYYSLAPPHHSIMISHMVNIHEDSTNKFGRTVIAQS